MLNVGLWYQLFTIGLHLVIQHLSLRLHISPVGVGVKCPQCYQYAYVQGITTLFSSMLLLSTTCKHNKLLVYFVCVW